jgi:hypothetical protein
MFARVTTIEIDAVRVSVDEAMKLFVSEVMPWLRQQPGYCGVEVLANDDGTALLVSYWETEEQASADRRDGFYAETLDRYVTLFRAPPGRQSYRVRLVEHPQLPDTGASMASGLG